MHVDYTLYRCDAQFKEKPHITLYSRQMNLSDYINKHSAKIKIHTYIQYIIVMIKRKKRKVNYNLPYT